MVDVTIVGESYFDRDVIHLLVKRYATKSLSVFIESKHDNKQSVLKDINKYKDWANNSERAGNDVFIIFSFDLDFDANCISEFYDTKGINPNDFPDNFLVTISVREIESWLLADPEGLQKWTKISQNNFERIPLNFAIEEKPTRAFLNVIAQKSVQFKKRLCDPINIEKKSEFYNEEMLKFVERYFDPERARTNNSSLDRFLRKIQESLG